MVVGCPLPFTTDLTTAALSSQECVQLVADVDGALRNMEHWVAATRDVAPTEVGKVCARCVSW